MQRPLELDRSASVLGFFGAELRHRREVAGLSVAELGRRVQHHPSQVSRVERGERVPSQDFATACDGVLAADGLFGRLWQLVQADRARQKQESAQLTTFRPRAAACDEDGAAGTLAAEVDALLRREFLAVASVAPFAATLTADHGKIGTEQARQIRDLVPRLYELDDSAGGPAVRDLAIGCLQRVDNLLSRADYGQSAGTDLRAGYGELAEMAGWLSFDDHDFADARFFLGEALRSAQLVDDLGLEVLTLASMNTVARYQHKPREAIDVIQLAQRRSHGWATPRLQALLLAREAVCWAQAGDKRASARTMNRALNVFAPQRNPDDPAWIEFFDEAELHARCATAWAYLGDPHRSAQHMGQAVADLRPEYRRNAAYYSVRRGLTLARTGAVDEACSAVAPVLGLYTTVRSGRALARFHEFVAIVENDGGLPAIDLLEQARHLRLVAA